MPPLPEFVGCTKEQQRQLQKGLREEIKSVIAQAVDGMFLLAQLHLDSLIGKRSPTAIRNVLKTLHKEFKVQNGDKTKELDSAYEKAMQRINSQAGDHPALAKDALSWVTCAKRPLSMLELQHALAVEIGKPEIDEGNLTQIETIVSVCAGLVAVDQKSGIIRLVHYTTQEYLKRTQCLWFPKAEAEIAGVCVTYLSFTVFGSGSCRTREAFEERLRSNPLYEYAAHNWGRHIRAASEKMEEEEVLLSFLDSEAKASSSSQVIMQNGTGYGRLDSRDEPAKMTGLHLAAHFELAATIMCLLKVGHKVDATDSCGRTPLCVAAQEGHVATASLLLSNNADPNLRDIYRRTPLVFAVENRHEAMVSLLLGKNADPEPEHPILSLTRRTLLQYAIEHRQEAVARLLLEKGADANSQDYRKRTPLSYAIEHRQEAVARLLLEKGADANLQDYRGRTPLSHAIERGYKLGVKLLLENGADPDIRVFDGSTPLWSAFWKNKNMVKLLLARDTDPDTKGYWGQTLLHATIARDETIVKLLLATEGIDINCKDDRGWTPLSHAVKVTCANEAIVKLLLANKGIDINCKDNRGRTPLSHAVTALQMKWDVTPTGDLVKVEEDAIVKLLLTKEGVDINCKDDKGRTPLYWAAIKGKEAAVKLLLAQDGIDVNCTDIRGQTPLCRAKEAGNVSIVKMLLAKEGVDFNSEDDQRRMPLWYVAKYGYSAMAELFIPYSEA